ncbi:MAG: PAS domain S-box protein [Desulfomonile tiedjei]|uniref:PAS domain S-box protein n=1 Tax=Desulfomonile tiedjei TaxID=2358 RepID=A0A9D6V1K0_9BACT|nr:PAS domain S-box protein [Desulfomonile tiedjei]
MPKKPQNDEQRAQDRAAELEAWKSQHEWLLKGRDDCAAMFKNLIENSDMGVYLVQCGIFKYVNPKVSQLSGYTLDELMNQFEIKRLVIPEDWPLVEDNLRKRLSGEIDASCYRFRGAKKNGEVVYLEVHGSRMDYQGAPAVLGTALDVTQQVESEAALGKELTKFHALYELAVGMTSDLELDETLMMVVEQARNLLGADTAYLALCDETAKEVYMHTLSGIKTEAFKKLRLPFGEGLGGKVATTGMGFIVEDYFLEVESQVQDIVRGEGLISGLAVPIKIGKTSLGVLYGFNRSRTCFSKSDLDTLSLLGNLAAIEIMRKKQETDLRKASEGLERKVQERTTELFVANEQLKQEIAERKKAENALCRNEAMLRDILATSPVGIGLTENRIIRWANESWMTMFGFQDEKEFVGRRTDILYQSEEEYERVGGLLYESLETGGITSSDATFRRKDGSIFYGHVRFKAVDPSDPSRRVISAISDVSDRRRAEEALREAQQRLELALTGADLLWWDWSIQSDAIVVGEQASATLGYSLDGIEPSFRFWQEIVHPDDAPLAMRALREHFEGLAPVFDSEQRLRTASGEWRWTLVRGKVVERDEQSNPLRMAGTFRDITPRKLAEEALRLSEQRFRAVFQEAEDFIFIKDRALNCIDANPSSERFVGVPASQLIGSQCDHLLSPDEALHVQELDERVLKGESVQEEHLRVVNGVPMVLLTTRVPLRDDSGSIVGILGISRDITDRKRIEARTEVMEDYPSKTMQLTLKTATLASKRDITVLLTGESGSGKDYLAKFIHDRSDRANRPYFSLNCAALTAHLAESELFGHEKGSFTGAVGRKRGMLELAEGGTLLLNEIGELSLQLQAKLLTFLDTRKFTRVGGEKEISVNVRIVAATNRNLEKETEDGRFRMDLFFRINVMRIEVPPLRERREDIPLLVRELLMRLRRDLQLTEDPVVDPLAMQVLTDYDWPGNVRELRNVLERALILSHGKKVNVASLGFQTGESSIPEGKSASFSASFPSERSLNEITREMKRFFINQALRTSSGSRQKAAKLLGISRYSLKHYMKSLGYDLGEE